MAVKKKFPYRSAFVACNGGCHVTEGSSCSYGCIACGKCVESCKFGAIHLNEHGVAYTTAPIPLLLNVPTKIKAKTQEVSVPSAVSAAASAKRPVLPVPST